MERRALNDPELRSKYIQFMRDYESDGHMKRVQTLYDETKPMYYIPHHALSPPRKFRVVFNASAPTSTGVSFNDIQLPGPRLQEDLCHQITNFRLYQVADADVKKMFRQIGIVPEQYDYQRIFWRENESQPVNEYVLTRVTYGMTSSAYNAVKAMQQCYTSTFLHG